MSHDDTSVDTVGVVAVTWTESHTPVSDVAGWCPADVSVECVVNGAAAWSYADVAGLPGVTDEDVEWMSSVVGAWPCCRYCRCRCWPRWT